MFQIIYISTASKLLNEFELVELLEVSRENNANNDITGMLLYAEGTFLQVLEGDKDAIAETYSRIIADRRHVSIIELASSTVTERDFPHWSMGFASANADILSMFTGYTNPRGGSFIDNDKGTAAITILKSFAENNRMN